MSNDHVNPMFYAVLDYWGNTRMIERRNHGARTCHVCKGDGYVSIGMDSLAVDSTRSCVQCAGTGYIITEPQV